MTDRTPAASPSAPPAGPYTPGLAVAGWVFLAGQTGAGDTLLGGALVEITAIAHRPSSL
jgi:enamine deaminase RidA (YjgF/YER057c/UK114 family)